MIMDSKLIFSENQAITASAASTNALKAKAADASLGGGADVHLEVIVTEAFAASGAATLDIALQDSADGINYTTVFSFPAIPKETLVKGFRIKIPLNALPKLRQYIQLYYTVTTGPMTAGKLTAGLSI